ncbi:MAG TPA: hypothetical protein VF316_10255 [Polyangiaceae bacterium]
MDTEREIAANRICTLLSRSELKDLVDLAALLHRGIELDQAFADARRKDAGAEPATLAWLPSARKAIAPVFCASASQQLAPAGPGFMQPMISGTPSPSRSAAARPPPGWTTSGSVHLSTSCPPTREIACSVALLEVGAARERTCADVDVVG